MNRRKVPIVTASDVAPDAIVQPIVPAITSLPDMEALANSIPQFSRLPPKRLKVLMELSDDLISETHRSDAEIAKHLGIDRGTVVYARQDPLFAQCLGVLVLGIARGRSDQYLRWTEAAAKKGNSSVIRLLWELTGLYVPKSKRLNVNVDMNQQGVPNESFADAVDNMLIALGSQGWSAEMIVSRYNELRSQGAW